MLRKDNPKTTIKILVYQTITRIVRKLGKSVREGLIKNINNFLTDFLIS